MLSVDHLNNNTPPGSLMYWTPIFKSATSNGRQNLRDQQGQPENPADTTNE